MMNLDYHAESVWQGLSLGRFHVHIEEVKRVLTPVLEEVYNFGYSRGAADQANKLTPENAVEEEKHDVPEVQTEQSISV